MRISGFVVLLAACRSEPLITVDLGDLGSAAEKLAAELEKAEARAKARPRAPVPRRKVPVAARRVIADARDAIATRDFKRLQMLLLDQKDLAFFKIGDTAVFTPQAAIDGWRSRPAILNRLDAALAAPCEVEKLEEYVECGGLADGDPMVELLRLDGTGSFKISAFDPDAAGRTKAPKARVLEAEVEVDEAD